MKRHSKSSILFNKIDIRLSKTFYGNTTGFMRNMKGRNRVLNKIDENIKNTNPELYSVIKYGFTKFQNSYDESMVKSLQNKFQDLIENDNYSKPIAEYDNKIYSRMINEPSKIFPELSKLITNDVLSFLSKYYTSNFTIKHIQCHRNYSVPLEIRKEHEMFSNFWHFDLDPTSQIKYFVYLSDVTEKDGPFHVQSKDRTHELIKMGFGNRTNYKLPQNILEDPTYVQKMIGPFGTSFFGNATTCLHRAGDLEDDHFRDAITFTIDPADEPIGVNWIEKVKPHPSQSGEYIASKED